jgi:hypothetical protein
MEGAWFPRRCLRRSYPAGRTSSACPTSPIARATPETSRGLLVAVLRTGNRQVYAINPLAAARYRDRHSVSRKKSDPGDALVLANILRTDRDAHRTLPQDSDLGRAIAVLARAQQDWMRSSHGRTVCAGPRPARSCGRPPRQRELPSSPAPNSLPPCGAPGARA